MMMMFKNGFCSFSRFIKYIYIYIKRFSTSDEKLNVYDDKLPDVYIPLV